MDHCRYPLNQSPLYRLQSRARLAQSLMQMTLPDLENLACDGNNYRAATRTTGGKQRLIHVARSRLLTAHRRMADLLGRIELAPYLHSGCKGRSYLSNAMAHAGAPRVAKLDVRRFYPSITRDRVWRFFTERAQCSGDVGALLARLSTYRGSVPIGSPVSELLAFHVVKPMLDELQALSSDHGVVFTCYVDDLSFSGSNADPTFLAAAKAIVLRHGYQPHAARCYGPHEEPQITGVLLTADGARVPPHQLARLEVARQQWLNAESGATACAALQRWLGGLAAAAAIESRFIPELRAAQRALRAMKRRSEK